MAKAEKLFITLLLTYSSFLFASYRVYELKIEHYNKEGQIERMEKVLSTLDPLQYAAFLGGDGRLKIRFKDTWYCPGDTSFRAYCAKPKQSVRTPASMEYDKRIQLPINRQPVIP